MARSLDMLLDELNAPIKYTAINCSGTKLKDLAQNSNTVLVADTSMLRMHCHVLEKFNCYDEKLKYLHFAQGQIKALKKLSQDQRLILTPSIYQEFQSLEYRFTDFLTKRLFDNKDSPQIYSSLFNLYSQTGELRDMMLQNINEEVEVQAQDLLSNVDNQFLQSYKKVTGEQKEISREDKLLYLSGLLLREERKGEDVCLFSRDSDIAVQPPIKFEDKILSVPVYFPDIYLMEGTFVDSFRRYEHKSRNSSRMAG